LKAKLKSSCKLCKLLRTNQKLWNEIHDLVLEQNVSYHNIVRYVNGKLDIINMEMSEEDKLAPLNVVNFSTHFRNHISESDKMTFALRKNMQKTASTANTPPSFSNIHQEAADSYLKDKFGESVTEYQKIVTMIDSLEAFLWDYEKDLKGRKEQGRTINRVEIKEYRENVQALMDMKTELNKFRNTSEVAGMAIRSAIELAITAFLDRLIVSTEEAKSILETEMPGSSLPGQVVDLIRKRIGDTMKLAIPEIYEKVVKAYSIRNLK
jgi:hypothetical protein